MSPRRRALATAALVASVLVLQAWQVMGKRDGSGDDLWKAGEKEAVQIATQPPIIHLPGVLSPAECARLIELAKEQSKMQGSLIAADATPSAHLQWQEAFAQEETKRAAFVTYDADKDGQLSETEVAKLLAEGWNMPNHNQTQLRGYLAKARGSSKGAQRQSGTSTHPLTQEEFLSIDWVGYGSYLRKKHPHLFPRYSKQTQLPHQEPLVDEMQRRLAKLMAFPAHLWKVGEPTMIVSYPKRGHYACHSDNTDEVAAYPHRYITVEVFLTDNFLGGELAFPFADSVAEKHADFRTTQASCLPTALCLANHSLSAPSGAVIVRPKKGDAIVWHNVQPDASGQVTSYGVRALHAGCEVKGGTKWIAVMWLSTQAALSSNSHPRTLASEIALTK